MSESQTPRTDAMTFAAKNISPTNIVVPVSISRRIELRGSLWKRAARAQRQDAKTAVRQRIVSEEYLTSRYRKDQSRIKELERELNEAKAKLKIATEALEWIKLNNTANTAYGFAYTSQDGRIADDALNQIKG